MDAEHQCLARSSGLPGPGSQLRALSTAQAPQFSSQIARGRLKLGQALLFFHSKRNTAKAARLLARTSSNLI